MMKISKQAMEMEKAQEVVRKQTKELLADPTNEDLQGVLKSNTETIERVSSAVVEKDATLLPSSIVEIEVAEKDENDIPAGVQSYVQSYMDEKFDKIMERIANINKADVPEGDSTGGEETPNGGEEVSDVVKGIALDIAVEVLNGYTSKISGLKAALESGQEVTKDDMRAVFGWETRDAIESAITAANIAKADDDDVTKAKDLLFDALTKNEDDSAGDNGDAGNNTPEGSGNTPDADDDLNKSEEGNSWIDLSPPLEDPEKTK
jgi:hypothetical protein